MYRHQGLVFIVVGCRCELHRPSIVATAGVLWWTPRATAFWPALVGMWACLVA